jgi:phosphopantothenoylcysteine decarboxylase/phosphopantothenate--cysteine ligase
MTLAAREFVTPLTFQAVTGRAVYTDLWQAEGSGLPTHVAHVGLGEGADLLAVVPATANSIAKLANGIADDLLSVTALASRAPLLIAPAMDGGMYQHPAVQANLETLKSRGAEIIEPESGRMASGLVGQGRLPETPALIGEIRRILGRSGVLAGRRVTVTAGGTQEAIDPVRYVTNRSSGKQGYAVAQAALDAGAEVYLITTVELPAPTGVKVISVRSAAEMLKATYAHAMYSDVLVMAAAVADFTPAEVADHKIKKQEGQSGLTLELARTEDILAYIHHNKQAHPRVTVGFAAESRDLLTNAQSKLARKGLDFIVANDISASDAGFAVDDNRVTVLTRSGEQADYPLMSKAAVAEMIVEHAAKLLQPQG